MFGYFFDDRHNDIKILISIIFLAPGFKLMEEQDSFEMLKIGLGKDFIEEACNWKYEES